MSSGLLQRFRGAAAVAASAVSAERARRAIGITQQRGSKTMSDSDVMAALENVSPEASNATPPKQPRTDAAASSNVDFLKERIAEVRFCAGENLMGKILG
ncbi:unnamed protein product [Gongylonema pulchrum]|uniref:ATP synthase-coupling factor 6, mitochondrial n=1 Tax=Gongylonema pulchrum TaxID=637853 RepID=A0A183D5V2_9BILA|nr:unnamed protein product [Gongylonema pulchrum]